MTFSISSSDSMTPLCSATKNGDVARVRALLFQGADVRETSGPNGMTALHVAAITGQAEIAYILCHADGADVDIQTQDGFAPLFLAVLCRRRDVVSALLTKNPKILLPNGKDRTTAFHEAAKLGELGILRQFFGRTFPGTDVNAKCGPDNNTPLHLAALNGDKASIEYLSQLFGTEINLKKANSTPLSYAIEKKNKANFTPLGCAILQGHLDAVNALLEAGADPYAKCGPDRLPAIHLAAYYGHGSIVKRLCAIPGMAHYKTRVPLDRCTMAGGFTTKIREELFKKAGIDYPNQTDITPLYYACEQGHVDAARALLDAGADVNLVCEPYRLSALHVAANNKQTQVFKELCKAPGIQLEQRTLEDYTPLGLVISQGSPDMLDCLLKAGANPNSVMAEMKYSPLHFSIRLKKPEAVQRLLLEKDKIKKNPRDATDHSPLFDAVVSRQKGIVEMLLQEGVDPNETFEKFQWTVLYYAAGKGFLDIVESLCSDTRTNIDKKGVDGKTALDIAEKNNKHDVVNFLRSPSTVSSETISADKIQKLINQKKYSEAKTATKKLLRDHPEDDDLLTVLGQISVYQTQYDEAHQYYQQALALVEKKHAPEVQKYWNYRGQTDIALAQNRPSEAEEYYEKAVKVQPDNSVHVTYFHSLGETFQKQGNFAKADEYFKKALKIDPNNSDTWACLGRLSLRQKKPTEARQRFLFALRNNAHASIALAGLGSVELTENNIEKAKSLFEQSLQGKLALEAFCGLGDIARQQNKPQEAEANYLKALRLNSRDSPALLRLGILAQQRKEAKKAEDYFTRAQEADPFSFDPYFRLGELTISKDRQRAVNFFLQAYDRDPEHLETLLYLGEFSADPLQATKYYEAALRLGKVGLPGIHLSKAGLCFENALQKDPKNITALFGLGDLFLQHRNYLKSREHYDRARALEPKNIRALMGLGNSFEDNPKEAVIHYERALEIAQNEKKTSAIVMATLKLAHVFKKQNNLSQAEEYFKKVLTLDSNNEEARKGLSSL